VGLSLLAGSAVADAAAQSSQTTAALHGQTALPPGDMPQYAWADPGGGSPPPCNEQFLGYFWAAPDGYVYQCVRGAYGYEWVNTGERWCGCGSPSMVINAKGEKTLFTSE